MAVMDSVNFIFIFHFLGHVDILKHMITTYFAVPLNDKDTKEKIVEIIKYHSFVLRQDKGNRVVYLFMMLFHMGGLTLMSCTLEQIRIKTDDLALDLYQVPWEKMSINNQKLLIPIMLKMQKTLIFEGSCGLQTGVRPLVNIITLYNRCAIISIQHHRMMDFISLSTSWGPGLRSTSLPCGSDIDRLDTTDSPARRARAAWRDMLPLTTLLVGLLRRLTCRFSGAVGYLRDDGKRPVGLIPWSMESSSSSSAGRRPMLNKGLPLERHNERQLATCIHRFTATLTTSSVHLSKSLKTSSNAFVNSFGEITSPCLTPRCSWIGCVLSSCYRIDIVALLYKLFNTSMFGININGEYITHLLFADDILIMAESLEELNTMLSDLNIVSQQVGLKINMDKTKIMSNVHITPVLVIVGNDTLKVFDHYVWMGSIREISSYLPVQYSAVPQD
ncbi:hypothetical protein MSG28_006477 [Choristoneura fumiferana]|uniref:Uncharacterized protein n=1 Tax=Choristoneura fumiferana TaxID=7141 RepID=A0ACC0JF16_CHOFU|nr:hypothetical protein MSG28_006477 [Choristoneura fumiferana]